jgi:hypothetical protein
LIYAYPIQEKNEVVHEAFGKAGYDPKTNGEARA